MVFVGGSSCWWWPHPVFFCPQRKSRRYYPTRLAITLATGVTSSPAGGLASSGDSGFIVVETNYRIYAYTSTCPQGSLVSLSLCEEPSSSWPSDHLKVRHVVELCLGGHHGNDEEDTKMWSRGLSPVWPVVFIKRGRAARPCRRTQEMGFRTSTMRTIREDHERPNSRGVRVVQEQIKTSWR